VLWSILLVALGTAAGSSARTVADDLGRIGWGVVAIGIPVALVVAAGRRRRAATPA
jgi:membrane protein DedA with SNARE-associated domain